MYVYRYQEVAERPAGFIHFRGKIKDSEPAEELLRISWIQAEGQEEREKEGSHIPYQPEGKGTHQSGSQRIGKGLTEP